MHYDTYNSRVSMTLMFPFFFSLWTELATAKRFKQLWSISLFGKQTMRFMAPPYVFIVGAGKIMSLSLFFFVLTVHLVLCG